MKQNVVAVAIKAHHTTIRREIARNTVKRGKTADEYVAKNARLKRS
jgi:IS30 family transposase